MPRKPPPTVVRQLRGDRASLINRDEPQPPEQEPTPPPDRDEAWLAVWAEVENPLPPMQLWWQADRAP